jgi:arginine:pyruvate transaminase
MTTGMRFARLVDRICSPGAAAWDTHFAAVRQMQSGEVAPDAYLLLSVGDPDFDTPPVITDAAIASLRAGHTHYTEMSGTTPLRQLLAADYATRIGQPVTHDQVTVVAGAQNALFATCLTLLDPGDEVIVFDPMYVTYRDTLGACGATLVAVPARPEHGFIPLAADIAAAITPATRAILVNDPNNPTGAVLPQSTWHAIAALAQQHGLWVIVDEVYRALHFPTGPVPFTLAALPGMADRTIVLNSLSKSHAMSGWRLGWTIGPPAFAEHAARLNIVMLYGGPEFIQHAACVALDQASTCAQDMARAYAQRAAIVVETLARSPAIHPIPPQAGMFVLADIRACGIPATDFARHLFETTGIVVLAGDAFGTQAAGHIRIGLVHDEAVLHRACLAIVSCADYLAARSG